MLDVEPGRNMIASGIARATEAGLLTLSYEDALKVADHVLETLDAWDCIVTFRPRTAKS